MSHVPDISDLATSRIDFARANRLRGVSASRNGQASDAQPQRVDSVELSPEARAESGPIRTGLIAQIRDEIESGTYETDARLDRAIEALVEDLGG